MKTLLISIHPRHSQNILAGRKSIELRKRPFKQKDGSPVFDHLLIYETHPTAAIVGYCKAVEIMEKSSLEWVRDFDAPRPIRDGDSCFSEQPSPCLSPSPGRGSSLHKRY
jgi:predicted transcriptional regulator